MNYLETTIVVLYFLVLGALALFGLHRYYLVFLFYKFKNQKPPLKGTLKELPGVTIQLPIFNEMYVVKRLIDSVVEIDYPRELLDIQVLDDSLDETCDIARACVEQHAAAGVNIRYIHRKNRKGFKAGALDEGLKTAKGEYILIFDADFIPRPGILKDTVHYFSDEKIGMVQVRWGHINRDYSLLTQIQSIFLDGHFVVEHTARNRFGCFFNFNGTAGIWRRTCIEAAGGWQHDTLTEDLDLSYRAQLAGWKFIFLPHICAPAELPVEMNSFKTQQHRWAKGSIQTGKKLLPRILKSNLPFRVKLEATLHLVNNTAYLLMVCLSILVFPAMIIRCQQGWKSVVLLDIPLFFIATMSVSLFYITSQREIHRDWLARTRYIPFLMSLGIGLSINNAKAVMEALLNHETVFQRTPKYAIEKAGDKNWKWMKYRGQKSLIPVIELLLGIYFTVALYFTFVYELYASLPFILLFQIGFIYIAFMSLFQSRSKKPV